MSSRKAESIPGGLGQYLASSRCSFIKLKVAGARSCNLGESAGLGVLAVGALVMAPEEKAVWILNRAVDTG